MRAIGPESAGAAVDATSNEAAASSVTPPINPELVRAPEVPAAKKSGSNAIEILLFRGLSTPLALLLVVLQGRYLAPSGRGTFVLTVLTVTIFSRLLSQLGVAVANRMGHPQWDEPHELRPLAPASAPPRGRLRHRRRRTRDRDLGNHAVGGRRDGRDCGN